MTAEGRRERRQRETRARIGEAGLRLFLRDGYEETTLDAIAEEAGISRRTFFSYFRSKDDILLAWQAASWQTLCRELLTASPDESSLPCVRSLLVKHASRYEAEEMRAIDRVMRSSETLQAKKQGAYARQEEMLYETLCQVWRQPARRPSLRLVAMVSIGAMRLAIRGYSEEKDQRSVAEWLEETFRTLGWVVQRSKERTKSPWRRETE